MPKDFKYLNKLNSFDMKFKRIYASRKSNMVRKLRDQKLHVGLPFMINVKELSSNQSNLEYPDGVIKLVSFVSSAREMNVLNELNPSEPFSLRKRLNLTTKYPI